MSEISDLIEKRYGHHYTPQTISNMTKAMSEQFEAFKSRPLDKHYTCVYLDVTYISHEHAIVSKEAGYIAVGIWEDGSQEVLLFISDGLKSITGRIVAVFPDANYQAYCVHLSRNISHKVRVVDRLWESVQTFNRRTGLRVGNWEKRR